MKALINGITVEGSAAEIAEAALAAGIPAVNVTRGPGRPKKDTTSVSAPVPVKSEPWRASAGIPAGLPVSDGKNIGFTVHTPQKGMRTGTAGLYMVVGEGIEQADQIRAGFHYVKDAAGCLVNAARFERRAKSYLDAAALLKKHASSF